MVFYLRFSSSATEDHWFTAYNVRADLLNTPEVQNLKDVKIPVSSPKLGTLTFCPEIEILLMLYYNGSIVEENGYNFLRSISCNSLCWKDSSEIQDETDDIK